MVIVARGMARGRVRLAMTQPRSQGPLYISRERTLVAAGHVPPRIWVVTKNSLKGGRLRLLLSILSLQESVKCCHQSRQILVHRRLCKAVGDRTWSKNLFSRANRPLLAAASMPQKISLSGQTLIQDKYIDLR